MINPNTTGSQEYDELRGMIARYSLNIAESIANINQVTSHAGNFLTFVLLFARHESSGVGIKSVIGMAPGLYMFKTSSALSSLP